MKNLMTKARAASVVLGATCVAGGILAPGASAYSGATAACQGASINGAGASLQKAMQNGLGADIVTGWTAATPLASLTTINPAATDGFGFSPYNPPNTTWPPPTVAPTPGPAPATNCINFRPDGKAIHYASIGSGGGRNLWAANGNAASRDTTADWVSSDEPLSPTEKTNVQTVGLTSTGSKVEQFPMAQAAVAIIVNLPDGCQLHALDGYRQTILSSYEALMFGAKSRWGTLLSSKGLDPTPDTTDTPRDPLSSDPNSCANQPVERVVRTDSSGSTFAMKKVFNENDKYTTGNPVGRWNGNNPTSTDYLDPSNNTVWPSTVTKPAATGGGGVASYVKTHPGSIGYVDLATARANGFDTDGTFADHTLWLSVTVPASDTATTGKPTYTNDPGKDPYSTAYRTGRPYPFNIVRKGANCSAAPATGGMSDRDYLDVLGASAPTGTDGDWFQVTGARPSYRKYDYPFCTLTYVLAYDKYSRVPTMTEPRARSVYDYVKFLTSTDGQKRLLSLDYQPIPDAGAHPLRPINQAGLGRIQY